MNLHPDIAAVLEGRSPYAVITGDCLAVLPTLPEGCADAVVTGNAKHFPEGLGLRVMTAREWVELGTPKALGR